MSSSSASSTSSSCVHPLGEVQINIIVAYALGGERRGTLMATTFAVATDAKEAFATAKDHYQLLKFAKPQSSSALKTNDEDFEVWPELFSSPPQRRNPTTNTS